MTALKEQCPKTQGEGEDSLRYVMSNSEVI